MGVPVSLYLELAYYTPKFRRGTSQDGRRYPEGLNRHHDRYPKIGACGAKRGGRMESNAVDVLNCVENGQRGSRMQGMKRSNWRRSSKSARYGRGLPKQEVIILTFGVVYYQPHTMPNTLPFSAHVPPVLLRILGTTMSNSRMYGSACSRQFVDRCGAGDFVREGPA